MNEKVRELEKQLMELKGRLSEARRRAEPQSVEDYVFETAAGTRRLSELFGDHSDLILIHNMGRSCNYCSLWADTLTGYADHLRQRCALVLVSGDSPKMMDETAMDRGWNFPLATDPDGRFSKDMGYFSDGYEPGVSAFHKSADGSIVRTGTSWFGPGDDFCPIWHMFDLFPNGANGWEPK